MLHAAPSRPWEEVGVDIFTFRNIDYLITDDYLSDCFETDSLPSKCASDVIHWKHSLRATDYQWRFAFNSAEFQAFAQKNDFKHTTSSPHYPQSNGKIESVVKVASRLMERALEDREDVFLALLAWWNAPLEQLGPSPAQIMFGIRTCTQLPSNHRFDEISARQTNTWRSSSSKGQTSIILQPKSVTKAHTCCGWHRFYMLEWHGGMAK